MRAAILPYSGKIKRRMGYCAGSYNLESGALFFIVLRFLLRYQFKLPCFHKIIL